LLAVSSTWRQVALEFLWHKLSLTIDATPDNVRLHSPKWLKANMLPYNASNLTKEICVSVSLPDIVSGVAHKLLFNYIGDTKRFLLAYKLTVLISDYKSLNIDATDVAITNALEFAELLKSMAPSALTREIA
ncbi:hypothetical protein GGF41_005294, partial [Coemansia sp. RSA 2531]